MLRIPGIPARRLAKLGWCLTYERDFVVESFWSRFFSVCASVKHALLLKFANYRYTKSQIWR